MKNKIIHASLFIVFCFVDFNADAQDVSNYFLAPTGLILPVGEKVDIRIRWEDNALSYTFHEGSTAFLNGAFPEWSINGKPAATADKSEGSIFSGLKTADAIYTAPDKIPPVNPVMVAVKFKANDTSKQEVTLLCTIKIVNPGQNWYFSYSGHNSSEETLTSPFHQLIKRSSASGAGSMILDAQPPVDGYVIINTEQGDKVLQSFVSGVYNYYNTDTHEDANKAITDKRIINYSGKPETSQSLLFEYNSKDKSDQGGIQGAGISFDVTGTDEIWNRDVNGQLRKASSQVNEKSWAGLSLGHKEDKVTKIKNGFAIDYSQSKDTSFTDAEGGKHTIKSVEQYHAELTRINKK